MTEKKSHAWLEDKLTGEELIFKTTQKELCILKLNYNYMKFDFNYKDPKTII